MPNKIVNQNNTNVPDIPPGLQVALENEQKDIALKNQGYKDAQSIYAVPLTNYDKSLVTNGKRYKRYLGDQYGFVPNMSKKDLDYYAAKNQSATEIALNLTVYQVPKLGNNIVREVGKLGGLVSMLGGDYSFDNFLIRWTEENKVKFSNAGMEILSKYPDEVVGDFRGFLNFTDQLLQTATVFALEGMGIGGAISKGVGALTKIAGMGAKAANVVQKAGQLTASFAVSGFESADIAIDSYAQVKNQLINQINPSTGRLYTEQEAELKANEAAKISFWTNQTIMTALNFTGMGAMVSPEKAFAKEVEQIIAKDIIKEVAEKGVKEGVKNVTKGVKKELQDEIIDKAGKEVAKRYGWGSIAREAGQEAVEELFNNYSTNVAVNMQVKDHTFGEAMGDKDVLKESFLSKEAFWSVVGGVMGGAGQHIMMSRTPINLNTANDGDAIINRDSYGRQIYVTKDIDKTNKDFLSLPKEVQENLINSQEVLTTKKPVKPKGGFKNKAEEDLYNSQLAVYKQAQKKEFFKSAKKRANEQFLDILDNRAMITIESFNDMSNNLAIIESELKKQREGKEFNQATIDKAKYNLFSTTSAYHVKNGSAGNHKVVFEQIANMKQEDAIELGLAENDKDTSYKDRAKEAIKDIDIMEKEYKDLDKKYWDKANVIDGTIVDILFDSFVASHNSRKMQGKYEQHILDFLAENNMTKEKLDDILVKYLNDDKVQEKILMRLVMNQLSLGEKTSLNNSLYMQKYGKLMEDIYSKRQEAIKEQSGENKLSKDDKDFIKQVPNLINNILAEYVVDIEAQVTEEVNKYMKSKEVIDKLKNQIRESVAKNIKDRNEAQKKKKEEAKRSREKKQTEKVVDKNIKDTIKKGVDKMTAATKEAVTNLKNKKTENDLFVEVLYHKIDVIEQDLTEAEKKGIEQTSQYVGEILSLREKVKQLEGREITDKEVAIEVNNINKEMTLLSGNIAKDVEAKTKSVIATTGEIIEEQINEEMNKINPNDIQLDSTGIENMKKLAEKMKVVQEKKEEGEVIAKAEDYMSEAELNEIRGLIVSIYPQFIAYLNSKKIEYNINSIYHYVDYYNLVLSKIESFNQVNREEFKRLYEQAIVQLLQKNSAVNWAVIGEFHNLVSSDGKYGNTTVVTNPFPYNIDESKNMSEDYQYMVQDYTNKENKLTNPANSVAYNERQYIKVVNNDTIEYIEIENIRDAHPVDFLKEGDELIMEVIDSDNNDNIQMVKANGDVVTWKQMKEELNNKDEEYRFVPIVIKKGDTVIGMLHTEFFIARKNMHVAEEINIDDEIESLNNMRKQIIEKGVVTTTIKKIKNGVLNKDMNNLFKPINENIPNINNDSIVVFKEGKFYSNNIPIDVPIVNWEFFKKYNPTGSVFVLLPNATKTAYFAEPLKITKLGNPANKTIMDSLGQVIENIIRGKETPFKNIDELNSFFEAFVYSKSFNLDTMQEQAKNGVKFFFNVTKDGDIQFAHNSDKEIDSAMTIFTIGVFGKNKGKIMVTTNRGTVEAVREDKNIKQVVDRFKFILGEKYFNVNLKKLSSKEKFFGYDSYGDLLRNVLLTDVIEKKLVDDNNNVSYGYTIQPTVEFDNNFSIKQDNTKGITKLKSEEVETELDKKNNQEIKEEIDIKLLDSLNNMDIDDEFEEFDAAIDYTDEMINNISKIDKSLTTKSVSYQTEDEIIKGIIYSIYKDTYNGEIYKDIDTTSSKEVINKYLNDKKGMYQKALEEYKNILAKNPNWDVVRNKKDHGTTANMTKSQLEKRIEGMEDFVNNYDKYRRRIIATINEKVLQEDELESKHEEEIDEREELERKPMWDRYNAEIDVMEKGNYKFNMLLSTIPIANFVRDSNNKIEMVNGKPRISYKLNSIGDRLMEDRQHMVNKLHNILIDYSHVTSSEKFNKFISVLENSGDAQLYLLSQELKNADDTVKAALINTGSVQDTNSSMFLFESRPVKVFEKVDGKLQPKMIIDENTGEEKQKIEIQSFVYAFENSRNSAIKMIIEDFNTNAATTLKNNKLLKRDGDNVIFDNTQIKNWIEKINNKTFTEEDFKEMLWSLGLQFTPSEYNKLFYDNNVIKNVFGDFFVGKIDYLYVKNSFVYRMLNDILESGNGYNVNILNPLSNVNRNTLKNFAKLKLLVSKRYNDSTFKNGEGNRMQSITQNTMMSRRLGIIKDSNKEVLNKLRDVNSVLTGALTKGNIKHRSFWVQEMVSGNGSRITNGIFDSMKKKSNYTDAVTKPNMTDDEILVESVFGFTQLNSKTFMFSPFAYSDKKTVGTIQAPKFDIKWNTLLDLKTLKPIMDKRNLLIDITKSSTIKEAIDLYFLQPEIKRINKHIDAIYSGDITENELGSQEYYGSFFFYLIPQLNEIGEIRTEDGHIKEDQDSLNIMRDIVIEHINEMYLNNLLKFNDLFIKPGKEHRITLIPTEYIRKTYQQNKFEKIITNQMAVNFLALDYTFNYMLGTAEYTKLIGSFPSSTYKVMKSDKVKDYVKTGKNFIEFIEQNKTSITTKIKGAYKEYIKRLAKDIAPRMDGYWQDKLGNDFSNFIQLYVAEPKTGYYAEQYKKLGIEGYEGVESADAQEYQTFKEYIAVAHAYQNIPDNVYVEIMNVIKQNEEENKQIIEQMEKEGKSHEDILNAMKPLLLTEEQKNKLSVGNIKPIYAGKVWNNKLGRDTSRYIKVATFTLVPGIVLNSELDMLRRQAEYLQIKSGSTVRIAMISGVKEGAYDIRNIWKENKNNLVADVTAISKLTGELLSRDYFGIQQEEPLNETKTSINLVTQANKLLFAGLLTGYKDTKDSSMSGFKWFDEDMTALEMKDLKESIRKQIVRISYKSLLDELNLMEGRDGIRLKGNIKMFYTKLKDIIENEMISRNYPLTDKLAIDLLNGGEDFKFPLDFTSNTEKLEALLLSLVTNRIVKSKIPGKNFINTSGNGIMTYTKHSELPNDIIYTKLYKGDRLNYVSISEDGQTMEYAQCFVPFNFTDNSGKLLNINDFTKIENGKKVLDRDKMTDDLLKLIGLRIPNQGHSSMLTLEIAGFLPSYMKNTIILPSEITKQMGSDNDYDHLYTYSYNTKYNVKEELWKEEKDKLVISHHYDNYEGDKEYNSMKSLYDEIAIKYSKKNIDKFKSYLTDKEKVAFDELLEKQKTEKKTLFGFETKSLKTIQEEYKEQPEYISLKDKYDVFITEWKRTHENRKDEIAELKTKMSTIRSEELKKAFKELKNKLIGEGHGLLSKVQYGKEVSNNNMEQLQNMYVDIFHAVLSNPQVTMKMLTRLDIPYMGNESDNLRSILEQGTQFNPLSIEYAISSYMENQTGKVGVAIQSLVSTFLALIEDKDLKLRDTFRIKIKDNNDSTKIITGLGVGSTIKEKQKGKEKEPDIPISNLQINQMLQNEAVDNAKNLKLFWINYNSDTAPFYNVLLSMITEDKECIPMETLTRLMTQEVMFEYAKQIKDKDTSIKDFSAKKDTDIFKEIADKFAKKYVDKGGNINEINMKPEDFVLEKPSVLQTYVEAYMNNQKKDKDYYKYQAELASWLSNMYNVYIKPINSVIMNVPGIDSKSIGKNLISMMSRRDRIMNSIENAPVVGIEKLFKHNNKDTEIGTIFNLSFDTAYELYINDKITGKSLFGYNSRTYQDVLALLDTKYGVELEWEDNKKKMWKSFRKYLMMRAYRKSFVKEGTFEESITDTRKRLLFGDSSLAIRTKNYQEEQWFKNNDFLIQLVVDLNQNTVINETGTYTSKGDNPMYVTYSSYMKDRNKDLSNIIQLFNEFIKAQKEYKSNKLDLKAKDKFEYLEDIIKYTILEGGVQNAYNWIKFIHPIYLEQIGFLNSLRTYQSELTFEEIDDLTEQALRHETELLNNLVDLRKTDRLSIVREMNPTTNSMEIMKIIFDSNNIRPESEIDSNERKLSNGYAMFRYYDKDLKQMLLFKLTNTDKGVLTYTRINPLGTDKSTEYGDDVRDTMFPENKQVNQEEITTEKIEVNHTESNGNIDKFDKEPTYKTVKEIIDSMSLSNDPIRSVIAKIIQTYPELYNNIIFFKSNGNTLGEHYSLSDTGKTTRIGINTSLIRTKGDNIKAEEIFNNVLVHELLHCIFVHINYRVKNKLATDEQIKLFSELENLRVQILEQQKIKYAEEYQEYLRLKQQNIKISEEMLYKFEAFVSITEMLSYGWSNKEVMNEMKNTTINKANGFERFKEITRNLLETILKRLNIKDTNNALAEFINISLELYSKPEGVEVKQEIKQKVRENVIYPLLGNKTQSKNVKIESWSSLKDLNEPFTKAYDMIVHIISTRIKNSNEHFDNPFTHEPEDKTKGLIKVNSVKEAVENYIDWILYNYQEPIDTLSVELQEALGNSKLNERREWIRKQLQSGELMDKPILYYTELKEPSHATALDYLINNYKWEQNIDIKEILKENSKRLVPSSKLGELVIVYDNKVYSTKGENITDRFTEDEIRDMSVMVDMKDKKEDRTEDNNDLKNIVKDAHLNC